jgi:hypothetical protein
VFGRAGGKTTDKWHCASFSPASQNAVHPDLPLLASHVHSHCRITDTCPKQGINITQPAIAESQCHAGRCHVHESPTQVLSLSPPSQESVNGTNMSQMNQVRIFQSYLMNIHFNIILQPATGSSKLNLSL